MTVEVSGGEFMGQRGFLVSFPKHRVFVLCLGQREGGPSAVFKV